MARIVVVADAVFTASAVILQPITGYLLGRKSARSLMEPWILWSLVFYLGAGIFWPPEVWL